MSQLIECYRDRSADFNLSIFQSDCVTAFNFAAGMVCRLKIYRQGRVPVLDLSSVEPSPGHSTLTPTIGSNVVAFHADTDDTGQWTPGAYDYEFDVVDAGDVIRTGWQGVFFLHPSGGGEIGEAESSSV